MCTFRVLHLARLESVRVGSGKVAGTGGRRLSGIDRNAIEGRAAVVPDARSSGSAGQERPCGRLGLGQRIVGARREKSSQQSEGHRAFFCADPPREDDMVLLATLFSGRAWPPRRAAAIRDATNASNDAATTNVRLPIRTTSTSPDLIRPHIDVFPSPINSRAVFTEIASGPSGREIGSTNSLACSFTHSERCAATADCSPRATTSLMRSASERAAPVLCPQRDASWAATTDCCRGSEALCVPLIGDADKSRCDFDNSRPLG